MNQNELSKSNVTLRMDDGIVNKFREKCKKEGIIMSKVVERFMMHMAKYDQDVSETEKVIYDYLNRKGA